MLLIGLVLIVLALVVPALHVLFWIGVVLAIVGAILLLGGHARGAPYGGRYYY